MDNCWLAIIGISQVQSIVKLKSPKLGIADNLFDTYVEVASIELTVNTEFAFQQISLKNSKKQVLAAPIG